MHLSERVIDALLFLILDSWRGLEKQFIVVVLGCFLVFIRVCCFCFIRPENIDETLRHRRNDIFTEEICGKSACIDLMHVRFAYTNKMHG